MPSALSEAIEAFAAQWPDAARDPAVAEAALAVAREAAEAMSQGERVTYLRVWCPDLDVRQALADVRALVARLDEASLLARWWWLEKQDEGGSHLRLRLHGPARLGPEELAELGDPYQLRLLRYEPEMALFGGPVGLGIAHRFHHLDSLLLSEMHLLEGAGEEVPVGVTVRAVEALFQGAELDRFERWDVWQHAVRNRPLSPDAGVGPEDVRWFEQVRATAREELAAEGPFEDYVGVGAELAEAHRRGSLERGPRQVIAGLLVFHCNRARLGYVTQARLARAAAAAYDPMPEGER